jgi:hypothetical protein
MTRPIERVRVGDGRSWILKERSNSNLHRRPFFIEVLSRPDLLVGIGIDDLAGRVHPEKHRVTPTFFKQGSTDVGLRARFDQISRSGSGHEAQRDDAAQHRIRRSNEHAEWIVSRQCNSDTTRPAMSLLIRPWSQHLLLLFGVRGPSTEEIG